MILKNLFIGCLCSVLATVNLGSNQHSSQQIGIKEVLISAHRGGPIAGFPENALETMQNTSSKIPGVMLEMDIQPTKDSVLVLMHDDTLDRTTNLKGYLKEYTFNELKAGFLKDNNGLVTIMKIPALIEVFDWVKYTDVYLSLDIKDKAIFYQIIDLVNKYQLKDKIEIITYSIQDAELIYKYDPEIYISVSLGSEAVLQKYLATNMNTSKLAAFTGSALQDASFYKILKNKDIAVTLGTMGNLDNKAKIKGFRLFKKWNTTGVTRFATDYPFDVYKIFNN